MGHDLVKAVHDCQEIPRSLHKPHMLLARAKKSTDEYTQKQTMPLKSPIRLLCLVVMVSFCLLARSSNAGEISATPSDSEVITLSKEKYDAMLSEKDVLQREIARLQSMLKSRKRFREVLPVQSANLAEDEPSDEPSEECLPDHEKKHELFEVFFVFANC